jgi:Holliday junction DNA helicase RuvA
MIARIKGILAEKTPSSVIVDCNGVGYLIFTSVRISEKLPALGEEVTLLTHLIQKEDASDLYGFLDYSEKQAFLKLISVSKIGPKTAIGILSAADLTELRNFIITGNHRALSKLPGIGLKTAERIVVELKDKFAEIETTAGSDAPAIGNQSDEAISALIALGYNKAKAEKFVKAAMKEMQDSNASVEQIIKFALKFAIS